MRLNMNLQKEFEKILKDFGHDVLVLKKDHKLFCTCYNEVTQEASRDCPICLGLGYTFTAERHRVRNENASSARSLYKVLKDISIGSISTIGTTYYGLPSLKITEKDLIVEVDWDSFGKPTYSGKGIWGVSNIMDMNLGNENAIYKSISTSETPVKSKVRGIHISELNGIKQYNVLMEE